MSLRKIYRTVKTLSLKIFENFSQVFLASVHNIHSIAYGFTTAVIHSIAYGFRTACYPSMLGGFLGFAVT